MDKRSNIQKVSRQSAQLLNSGQVSSKVAAKSEDIKIFDELIRERKRLNERRNQNNNEAKSDTIGLSGDKRLLNTQMLTNNPKISPDAGTKVSRLQQQDNQRYLIESQVVLHSAQSLDLSISTSHSNQTAQSAPSNAVTQIVVVIQRIITNHTSPKLPKEWHLRISIDAQQSLDLSIEYLGKDEWRIGIREDDQNDNPTGMSADELCAQLEAELAVSRPEFRITAQPLEES